MMVVPLLSGCLGRTPETYHSGRSRAGDRHSKSTTTGTTSFAYARTSQHQFRVDDTTIDEDGPAFRQPDRIDAAILHTGHVHHPLHWQERRFAYVKTSPHNAIDVNSGREQRDASGHAL